VGLFYRQGYFRQELAPDGWQEQRYVTLDPNTLALEPCEDLKLEVDEGGVKVAARVWRAQVGRVPLYLLDTDVEGNDPGGRTITDRLYGGDTEHRLRQEVLLGIGGVRALSALGVAPQVFHTNEGHAGFLGLERIRCHVVDDGLAFDEAVEAVRAGTVFTTHTPVPAGIDRFPRALMERYFGSLADQCGVSFDTLMALGHEPADPPDAPFNMAVMGLRLASSSNGVSVLHGAVSRRIFAGVWPGVPVEELPIDAVTNGVHGTSWVSPEMKALFGAHVGEEWWDARADEWAGVDQIGDAELWDARGSARRRMVDVVRARLRTPARARHAPEAELSQVHGVLDPDALTIGFARRFASYKRATLLLSQPDRLASLLSSADRPVQMVFAGKAHPADDLGKEMIRQVVQFSRRPDVAGRLVFVEDYDIALAQALYHGSDVWLNTPRRPLEACGTSGEKAALNGALNCSILDGWWDECYDGDNGWAIPSAEQYDDVDRRDALEADALFGLLEHEVVPLFYDRPAGPGAGGDDDGGGGGVPVAWLAKVRASLRSLGPCVLATRMVRDYVRQMYQPAAFRQEALAADGHAGARELAAWKGRVRSGWAVRVEAVDVEGGPAEVGVERAVRATVALGDLSPADVDVQLLHGPVAASGDLEGPTIVTMAHQGAADGPDRHGYTASFVCDRPGRYGCTVRVVPRHRLLRHFSEVGPITWA
jgi:starch phosphorylase